MLVIQRVAGTQLGQERCLEHRGFNWRFLAVFIIRNNGKKTIVPFTAQIERDN